MGLSLQGPPGTFDLDLKNVRRGFFGRRLVEVADVRAGCGRTALIGLTEGHTIRL